MQTQDLKNKTQEILKYKMNKIYHYQEEPREIATQTKVEIIIICLIFKYVFYTH